MATRRRRKERRRLRRSRWSRENPAPAAVAVVAALGPAYVKSIQELLGVTARAATNIAAALKQGDVRAAAKIYSRSTGESISASYRAFARIGVTAATLGAARRNPVWEEERLEDIERARKLDIAEDEDLLRAERQLREGVGSEEGYGARGEDWDPDTPAGIYKKGSWEDIHSRARAAIRRRGRFLLARGYKHLIPELALAAVQEAQLAALEAGHSKALNKLESYKITSFIEKGAARVVARQRKFREKMMLPAEPVMVEGFQAPEEWKRLLEDEECAEEQADGTFTGAFPLLLQADPQTYYLWAMFNGICGQEDVPPEGSRVAYDGYSVAQLARMTGRTKPEIEEILDKATSFIERVYAAEIEEMWDFLRE